MLTYVFRPLLELANYHILGRILYYVPYFSPLHIGRVLATFGALSGVVETMNAIGVSYIANPDVKSESREVGHILMKSSLIIQIVVIGLFCALAFTFQRRCRRAGIRNRKVSGPLLTLHISMSLIAVRYIYRTVEHFGFSATELTFDSDTNIEDLSPIIRHEWYFYVFEAALMLINTWMWNWRHPRRYVPESYNVYLAQDGVTEIEGPGWKDNRPFVMTLIDPFGWFESRKRGSGRIGRPTASTSQTLVLAWRRRGVENHTQSVRQMNSSKKCCDQGRRILGLMLDLYISATGGI